MKYLLLVYADDRGWEALAGAEHGHALQPAHTATTVRVEDGETILHDGTFAAGARDLAGYHLLEAEDLDVAIALAARIPAARTGGAVEIRPVA